MTLNEISNIRIISQKIAGTDFKTANEIVGWMGAIQAQDYSMAKWAIGVRLLNPTDERIEESFNKHDKANRALIEKKASIMGQFFNKEIEVRYEAFRI